MCESCSGSGLDRREFLAASAVGAAGLCSSALGAPATQPFSLPLTRREKQPARVLVAFLYPPADVVNAGQMEDSWRDKHWFTWPGNQYAPEEQERKFTAQIRQIAERVGVTVQFHPQAIYQEAKVKEFIAAAKAARPDAVLIVNFWNTLSKWSHQMAVDSGAPTAIVYQPVGSNHQLPPEYLRNAERLFYIHSIENWAEIERGLGAVQAAKMLAQSRILRISGRVKAAQRTQEPRLGVDVIEIPAREFNAAFDAEPADAALVRAAEQFKQGASSVLAVTDEYLTEALRAHRAVGHMVERYGADAITIECLQLKHRKPCISFALNNGALLPCGCENDYNATLTLLLGRWLLGRAGFQHNPDFDINERRYYASHCTCALKLHGPSGAVQTYSVRPFFHQLPQTAALDVQWTAGEPVIVAKYLSGQDTLCCWTGRVIESPTSPPVGGCATRVLVELDRLDDVCTAYAGPHPILFCGPVGDARRLKAFAKMYGLKLESNL